MGLYRQSVEDIDRAIAAFVRSGLKAHGRTDYLVAHSRQPYLWAPVKPVMWPAGAASPSYAKATGGAARLALESLRYTKEEVLSAVFDDDEGVAGALTKIGLERPPERLTVYRFVNGEDLARVYTRYAAAEQALRQVLGRPHHRRDVLRATGEFLYTRLFGGVLCRNQNEPGYDVVHGKRRVQVKTVRKASSNPAGLGIKRQPLNDRLFTHFAVLWLAPDSRVQEFVELTADELADLASARGGKDAFDLKLSMVPAAIRRRSVQRFKAAAAASGLASIDATGES